MAAAPSVAPGDPAGDDARALIAGLWREECSLYGGDPGGNFPHIDFAAEGCIFLIARIEGIAVGSAALRPHAEGTAEIKRMFVAPAWRRRGIARTLLAEIERQARRLGYLHLCLETGKRQPAAIQLYESAGFQRIPCYGHHAQDPLSLCFGKSLTQGRNSGERAPARP